MPKDKPLTEQEKFKKLMQESRYKWLSELEQTDPEQYILEVKKQQLAKASELLKKVETSINETAQVEQEELKQQFKAFYDQQTKFVLDLVDLLRKFQNSKNDGIQLTFTKDKANHTIELTEIVDIKGD